MSNRLSRIKFTRDIAIVGLVLIGLGIILLQPWQERTGQRHVSLKGAEFTVRVATTPNERDRGLSGTPKLNEKDGMLFIFQPPEQACFWMKDMRYSLDILWFDAERKLIYQERNVAPESYPANFCSKDVANYVLEIPAGTAQRLGLELGDELQLRN